MDEKSPSVPSYSPRLPKIITASVSWSLLKPPVAIKNRVESPTSRSSSS